MTVTFNTGAGLVAGIETDAAALFHENTKLWEGVEAHKPRRAVSRQEIGAVGTVSAAEAAGMIGPGGAGDSGGMDDTGGMDGMDGPGGADGSGGMDDTGGADGPGGADGSGGMDDTGGPAAGRSQQATDDNPAAPAAGGPAPSPAGTVSPHVRELFRQRRTARGYADSPVAGGLLTGLLQEAYHVSGLLELPGGVLPLRTAPSAGGLYPIRLYVAAWRVAGHRPGCYRYDPLARTLSCKTTGVTTGPDIRQRWQAACGAPERSRNAAAVIALTAELRRTTAKYGDRGYRYALLEAGHIAQNLQLVAGGFGLSLQPQGAFYDDTVARLIGVDGVTTCPVYLLHVGVTNGQEAT